MKKIEGTYYKKDFPTLGLKDQPQYKKPDLEETMAKVNEIVDWINKQEKIN